MLVLIGIGLRSRVHHGDLAVRLPRSADHLRGRRERRPAAPVRDHRGARLSFRHLAALRTWLLEQLGLPEDLLRNVAIGLLFLVAATLLFPQVGELRRTAASRLSRRPGGRPRRRLPARGQPRARLRALRGPGARLRSRRGAPPRLGCKRVRADARLRDRRGVPMLSSRSAAGGLRRRSAARAPDPAALGRGRGLTALAIALNVDRALPDGAPRLHGVAPEESRAELARAAASSHEAAAARRRTPVSDLRDSAGPGARRDLEWINSKPLTLRQLRGKVVLIDFWTYSCINCLRTLPHVKAWYQHVSQRRTRRARGAHARVRVRARAVERRGSRAPARDHVPGRARQRLRHVERVPQPVLAGRST